jgi:hypothetical protein
MEGRGPYLFYSLLSVAAATEGGPRRRSYQPERGG